MKPVEGTLLQRAKKYTDAHRSACETWENGEIAAVWMETNGVICISYDNGRWFHYTETNGEIIWW